MDHMTDATLKKKDAVCSLSPLLSCIHCPAQVSVSLVVQHQVY